MCYVDDLNTLRPRTKANRLVGTEAESLLAVSIDNGLRSLIARAVAHASDKVVEVPDHLEAGLRTFVRATVMREPAMLTGIEAQVALTIENHRELVDRLTSSARAATTDNPMMQFHSPDYGHTYARATMSSSAIGEAPVGPEWLSSTMTLVPAGTLTEQLAMFGLSEYPAWDPAVVRWDGDDGAPTASVALTPKLVLVVGGNDGTATRDPLAAALQHVLVSMETKRAAILRRPLARDAPFAGMLSQFLPAWDLDVHR